MKSSNNEQNQNLIRRTPVDRSRSLEDTSRGKPSRMSHIPSLTVPSISDKPAVRTDQMHINSASMNAAVQTCSPWTVWLRSSTSSRGLDFFFNVLGSQSPALFILCLPSGALPFKGWMARSTTMSSPTGVFAGNFGFQIQVAKLSRSMVACSVLVVTDRLSSINLPTRAGAVRNTHEFYPAQLARPFSWRTSAILDSTWAHFLANTPLDQRNMFTHAAFSEANASNMLSGACNISRLIKHRCYTEPQDAFHARRRTSGQNSRVLTAFVVACNRQIIHENASRRNILVLITKQLSRRRNNVIKNAQPRVRHEKNYNRCRPTLMTDSRTVYLSHTFLYTFVCQADHLSCTRSIEKKRIFEVKAGPFYLLLTTEGYISKDRVKRLLSNDWEEAQIICPMANRSWIGSSISGHIPR